MKAFLLNFLVRLGGVGRFCWGTVSTDFQVNTPGGLHKVLVGLPRIFARGNWMEKLAFCAVFIYLFIICLFVVCLCVCFLIIFKGLVVGSSINYVVLVHSHTLP